MKFKGFKIGNVTLKQGKPLIAGILNVTPDSFSDGGKTFNKKDAIKKAIEIENELADFIDIGGESSRPGAKEVPVKEELRRVIPVIEAIRKKSTIPISIDTRKAEVATAAVEAGADMINDIFGFRDEAMIEVAAKCKKPVVVMHMLGTPETMQKNPKYGDVIKEVSAFLKDRIKELEKNGVKKIIIDPGIGFGKTVNQNLTILNNIEEFSKLHRPILIGASRKSFIAKIVAMTGEREVHKEDRLGGSITAHILSIIDGAAVIRVHDVAAHRQALNVALKIIATNK